MVMDMLSAEWYMFADYSIAEGIAYLYVGVGAGQCTSGYLFTVANIFVWGNEKDDTMRRLISSSFPQIAGKYNVYDAIRVCS